MLFNSYLFILLYLPVVLFGFFWISKYSHRLAAFWLGISSLFFYGYWDIRFVSLLLFSIAFNYSMGYAIGHTNDAKKRILIFAISIDLIILGIFKYTNFFISTINNVSSANLPLTDIVLPLGISFFTFTQIAFLVDVYRAIAKEYNLIHYLLFVTYFPHLIAGPVLHHKQMMPQFGVSSTYRINSSNITIGMFIFVIGLIKKVLLADSFAEYATPVFNSAEEGNDISAIVAWTGALAYTLQLYFDFSGYSDMAVGISKLFNVDLPINFNSPYKSKNIIDFWRRWHMTLSQFLRDYLYFSLGGNQHGTIRRYLNLMITMVLGGLWHGASWTFVAWGTLHGLYLLLNHAWRSIKQWLNIESDKESIFSTIVYRVLTFILVVIAWVFFRAETFPAAINILNSMFDFSSLTQTYQSSKEFYVVFKGVMFPPDSWNYFIGLFSLGFLIVFFLPNTQTIAASIKLESEKKFILLGALFFACFMLAAINASRGTSEFIYFNF